MKRSFDRADAAARSRPRRAVLGHYRYVRLRWRLLFAVLDAIGWWCRRTWEHWRGPAAGEPQRAEDVRSILLLQLDHLGDAVITTAMLPELRRAFPRARLAVLASARNHELFEACADVDRVHVARTNRFASRLPGLWLPALCWWGWRLRTERFDIGVDVRGEFPHALLLWLARVRRRVGWAAGGGGFLLTDSPRFVPRRPEVESRRALLETLGVAVDGELTPRVAGAVSNAHGDRPYVALHIGAGTSAKRWPIEHWRELLARLIIEYDAHVALIGGPADRARAAELLQGHAWPQVADHTGRLSLGETTALLTIADVFVGADSGPAHLAAALGRDVVVLFSGTNHAAQWQPRGPRVVVVRHDVACSPCHRRTCPWAEHPCMTRIRPSMVLSALAPLLAEAEARRRSNVAPIGASSLDGMSPLDAVAGHAEHTPW